MSSESTRNCLLDAAERVFAQHGYRGASVRTITAEAGVDLGSIRYHFGSKDVLFGEVLKRRLDPLCQERLDRLDAVRQAADGAAPELEAIIEAFLAPGLRAYKNSRIREPAGVRNPAESIAAATGRWGRYSPAKHTVQNRHALA